MISKDINGYDQPMYSTYIQNNRQFLVRIMDENNQEIDCAIKKMIITKGSCGSTDAFGVGSIVGNMLEVEVKGLSADIKGQRIVVQNGLWFENQSEYIYFKLGSFVVSEVNRNDTSDTSTILAYSPLVSQTGKDFVPPTILTLSNIKTAIAQQTGIEIRNTGGIDLSQTVDMPMDNLTCYQAMQILAECCCAYATDYTNGFDEWIWLGRVNDSVGFNVSFDRINKNPTIAESDYQITGVRCNTLAGNFDFGSTINFVSESNYVNQDIFNANYKYMVNASYSYRPATLRIALGDPNIDGTDTAILSVDGQNVYIPCHKIVHTYDGGWSTEITSAPAQTIDNSVATPAPLSSKIEEASEAVKETKQYFWHTTSDTGAGAGTHITEKPQVEFLDDPANGGKNTLIDSDGMKIRNGVEDLALFSDDEIDLGLNSENSLITMCKKRGSVSTKYTEGFEFVEHIPFTYQASTTKNGLTFTVDSSEGKITVTGTATADTIYQVSNYIQTPDGNDYRLEGCPEGGSEDTFFLYAGRYDGYVWHADYGDSVMWHRSEGSVVLYIFVKQGVTMDNDFLPEIWRGIILRGVTLSLSNNAPDEDNSKSIEMYTHYGEEDTEDLQEAYFRLGLEKTGDNWAALWLGDNFGINFDDNQMVVEGDSSNPVEIRGRQNRDAMLRVEHYSGVAVRLGVGSGGENHGVWSEQLNKWMLYTNGNDETIVGAINVTDASSARDSMKSAGMLKIHTQTINIGNLAAGATKSEEVNAKITGRYEGWAITGYYIGGTNQSLINVYGLRFLYGSQTIAYKVRNIGSSQATGITLEVRVLCSYSGD